MRVPIKGRAEQIVVGDSHSCALLSDGTVVCWGNNRKGQLGPNRRGGAEPRQVQGVTDAEALFAGGHRTCARFADATARCWGAGALSGASPTGPKTQPALVPLSGRIDQVGMGHAHICALNDQGKLWCWGENDKGQLGNGGRTASNTPLEVQSNEVTQVALGRHFSCALTRRNTIECWGDNGSGQLRGRHEGHSTVAPVAGVSNVAQLASYANTTCGRLKDGTVICWGQEMTQARAKGADWRAPHVIEGIARTKDLMLQEGYGCALLTDRTARCFGINDAGQLGNTTATPAPVATPVESLSGVKKMISNGATTCALVPGGRIKCWGAVGGSMASFLWGIGHGGGLLGYEVKSTEPNVVRKATYVKGLSGAVDFDLRDGNACALLRNGRVKCWGAHRMQVQKQCGLHEACSNTYPRPPSPLPALVAGVTNVVRVQFPSNCATNDQNVFFITKKGDAYEGNFEPMPLPNGKNDVGDAPSPLAYGVRVDDDILDVEGLGCQYDTGCRLAAKGSVECTGGNNHGQLGDGTFDATARNTYRKVQGVTGATQVVSGWGHACALLADRTIACWGANKHGQLGRGHATTLAVPAPIDLQL